MAASNAKNRKGAKGNALPAGVTVKNSANGDREYTTEVAGTPIAFRVEATTGDANGEVLFAVGGSMNRTGQLQGSDATRAAVKVLGIMRHDAKSRPDGFVYSLYPRNSDGFGKERRQIYEKIGFSSNSGSQYQYAIVRNGKLEPHTP